jgi:hypothetical protein
MRRVSKVGVVLSVLATLLVRALCGGSLVGSI